MDKTKVSNWPDEESPTRPPPIFGNFFEGWSSLFNNDDSNKVSPTATPPPQQQQERFDGADDTSFSSRSSSLDGQSSQYTKEDPTPAQPTAAQKRAMRRKSSIQLGNEVMAELLEKDNVRHAIEILQQALNHLDITQHDEGENDEDVSKIYSQIIKSLCDPTISKIVDEMTPDTDDNEKDIYHSVMWRLFTKVVESGHVLQSDAHLAVVSTLVDKGHTSLALQAIYALPRKEWDTQCYRTAVLLHLMQDPKQIMEAQGLLSDYGKPFLEIANPVSPTDLPPLRIDMPLMKDVTENDQFKLCMFYQAAQSKDNDHWNREKEAYETQRKENLDALKQRENNNIDWALEHLHIESEKLKVDRLSTENDNTMIYIAMNNNQFEYGWQVYQAMGDAVNEATPCIVMHLCWVAFRQIPIADMSYRTDWETRAWSVYSRFMCSEYLHPDQPEAPSFIHDILSIAVHSPEVSVDKKARYTKSMSVYNLLVRLHFDKLLCDDRVLEPILCAILYECKGSPTNIVTMCNKAFEIWDRKTDIFQENKLQQTTTKRSPYSIIWGLLILCSKSGNEIDLQKVLSQLLDNDLQIDINIPSSVTAPIQKFHDAYTCNQNACYFHEYMFRHIEYTDDLENTVPINMNDFGFLLSSGDNNKIEEEKQQYNQALLWRTNINETQEPNIAMAVIMGAAKQEKLVQKQMYYSTKKAKALIRHCLQLISTSTSDHQT